MNKIERMTEANVKTQVKKILKKYAVLPGFHQGMAGVNGWYFMPIGGPYSRPGIPDFILCIKGRFVGIETKTLGNHLTTLQELEISNINRVGGVAIVVNESRFIALENLISVLCGQPELGTTIDPGDAFK